MFTNQKVEVHCQTSIKGYYLLSVYNFHINAFLSHFPSSYIKDLRMYWIDGEKDYITRLKEPVPIHSLNFIFDGFDIQILTVEIELDNGFLIDTNLSEELFCRVPPDFPVEVLIEEIKSTDQIATVNAANKSISSLSDSAWITTTME